MGMLYGSSRWIPLALLAAFALTHAQAPVALPGGRMYEGALEEGEPYGFGAMVYPNGTYYRGEFVSGYREGRGTAVFSDGTRYEGEWRNDIPHGRGVIEWLTGERYEGEIVENMRSGRGVMRFRDGARYDGEWRDDAMNGRGVMTLPNGERTSEIAGLRLRGDELEFTLDLPPFGGPAHFRGKVANGGMDGEVTWGSTPVVKRAKWHAERIEVASEPLAR